MLEKPSFFINRLLLSLGIVGSMMACMPTGFLASKNSDQNTSIASDTKTQANDRPTETGAGVPGYLVNCTEVSITGELVQVGCSVSDGAGKRLKTTADAWNNYEVKVSAKADANIKAVKSLAASAENWDVYFKFTGAEESLLREAARDSSYSYTYTDEKGAVVRIETVSAPARTSTSTPTNCTGGVMVEGVCFMSVSTSCTDYCAQNQMTSHPWVVERFGSAQASNKQACADLYAQLQPVTSALFPITETITGRGLGCYALASGQVYFDTGPTDPSSTPFISYSRICGCQ